MGIYALSPLLILLFQMAHSAAGGVGFGAGKSSGFCRSVSVTEDDSRLRRRNWKWYHRCYFLGGFFFEDRSVHGSEL